MTTTNRWSKTRATRKMRWNEVARAAVILGIVPDYSRGSMLQIADMLRERVESGSIKKFKRGNGQSAAAFYWTHVEMPS